MIMESDFYIIKQIRPVIVKYAIRAVELDFFHGVALDHDPARRPFHPGPGLYPLRDGPSEMILHVQALPVELIMPTPQSNFVISEKIAKTCTIFGSCELREVIIRKVIDIKRDDPKYYDTSYCTSLDIFESCEPVILDSPLPKLFEVICPRYVDVRRKDLAEKHYHIRHAIGDEDVQLGLDVSFLEQFPILWHSGAIIVSFAAYDQLEPYLNPKYFAIQRCSL